MQRWLFFIDAMQVINLLATSKSTNTCHRNLSTCIFYPTWERILIYTEGHFEVGKPIPNWTRDLLLKSPRCTFTEGNFEVGKTYKWRGWKTQQTMQMTEIEPYTKGNFKAQPKELYRGGFRAYQTQQHQHTAYQTKSLQTGHEKAFHLLKFCNMDIKLGILETAN